MCPRRAQPSLDNTNPYYRNTAVFDPFDSKIPIFDTGMELLDRLDREIKALFYSRSLTGVETDLIGHAAESMSDKKLVYTAISDLYHHLEVCVNHLKAVFQDRILINPHLRAFLDAFVGLSALYHGSRLSWNGNKTRHHYHAIEVGYRRYQARLSSDEFHLTRRNHRNVTNQRKKRVHDFIRTQQRYSDVYVTTVALCFPHDVSADPYTHKASMDRLFTRLRRYQKYRHDQDDLYGYIARYTLHLKYGPYWAFSMFHGNPNHHDHRDRIDAFWRKDATHGQGHSLELRHMPDDPASLTEYYAMMDGRDHLVRYHTPPGFDRIRRSQ